MELSPEKVERGAYLVNAVAACGACHNGRPEGKPFLEHYDEYTSILGGVRAHLGDGVRVYAPNITSHADGIGEWSDDAVIRAIRDGVRPDGERLFGIMPYMTYQYMSDEDAEAIVAYLRSTAPVPGRLDRDDNEVTLLAKLAFGPKKHNGALDVPAADPSNPVAYGEYLVQLAHCGECHSAGLKPRSVDDERWLAGSAVAFPMMTGSYPAPNLTPTGLSEHSDDDIKRALRDGMAKDGHMIQPPMAYFSPFWRNMTDDDLSAIVAYLRSLPPSKGWNIKRKLNDQGEAFDALARDKSQAWQAVDATTPSPTEDAPAEEEPVASDSPVDGDAAPSTETSDEENAPAPAAAEESPPNVE